MLRGWAVCGHLRRWRLIPGLDYNSSILRMLRAACKCSAAWLGAQSALFQCLQPGIDIEFYFVRG